MCELPDNEDDDNASTLIYGMSPDLPWLQGYNSYLNSQDFLGDKTIVEWWGGSISCLPPLTHQLHPVSVKCKLTPCLGILGS
jgi:hypothetical protein